VWVKFIRREAEAVYEETLVAPSGLITGSSGILNVCGLGNSLWIAATLVAAGVVTGKEPVLPSQTRYMNNVFWKFHQVDVSSHTWTSIHERAYFFKPLPFKRISTKNKTSAHGSDVQIMGYRQSWRYFDEFRAQICERFTLRPHDLAAVTRLFAPIIDRLRELNLTRQDAVSVHVRRGDYLRKPTVHPVLSLDYYTKAVREVRKGLSSQQPLLFVIFSDDIGW
jgi:hypothetical protein